MTDCKLLKIIVLTSSIKFYFNLKRNVWQKIKYIIIMSKSYYTIKTLLCFTQKSGYRKRRKERKLGGLGIWGNLD